MLTASNSGALISGAPGTTGGTMEKGKVAKVIRGVYVRGVPKGEGEILRVPDDINGQEYAELKTANYIVDAEPPPDVAAKQDEAPAALLKPKKGDV